MSLIFSPSICRKKTEDYLCLLLQWLNGIRCALLPMLLWNVVDDLLLRMGKLSVRNAELLCRFLWMWLVR